MFKWGKAGRQKINPLGKKQDTQLCLQRQNTVLLKWKVTQHGRQLPFEVTYMRCTQLA